MNNNVFEAKVKDFTFRGKCSRCGQCCINALNITDFELERIKHFIKENDIKSNFNEVKQDMLSKNIQFNNKTKVVLMCPFYNLTDKVCNIYEVRPKPCRDFICNQSKRKIERNKNLFYKRAPKVTLLREECYLEDSGIFNFASMFNIGEIKDYSKFTFIKHF